MFIYNTICNWGWQILTKKLFRGRRNRRNNWFVPAEFRLFRGTENSRNSVPNRSAEEKNDRNSVPWNKIRSKCSVPNHSTKEKKTRNSLPWNKNINKHLEFCSEPFSGRDNNSEFREKHAVNSVCWIRIFCKTNFIHAISFRSELRNRLFRNPLNATEWAFSSAVPCLFRGIFSEGNSVANPMCNTYLMLLIAMPSLPIGPPWLSPSTRYGDIQISLNNLVLYILLNTNFKQTY